VATALGNWITRYEMLLMLNFCWLYQLSLYMCTVIYFCKVSLQHFHSIINQISSFLQCISIACYATRCISYRKSVRLFVSLSITRWHCVKMTPATIMGSSLEDSPMTLVSSWLTLPRNSKGNIGSEGAK